MNISKDSWHYKLIDKTLEHSAPSYNLCSYARRVFFSMVVCILLMLLAVFIGIFLLEWVTMLFSLAAGYPLGMYLFTEGLYFTTVAVTLFGSVGAAGVYTFIGLTKLFIGTANVIGDDNVVVEYIKARKDKFCPTIRVIENETEDSK